MEQEKICKKNSLNWFELSIQFHCVDDFVRFGYDFSANHISFVRCAHKIILQNKLNNQKCSRTEKAATSSVIHFLALTGQWPDHVVVIYYMDIYSIIYCKELKCIWTFTAHGQQNETISEHI